MVTVTQPICRHGSTLCHNAGNDWWQIFAQGTHILARTQRSSSRQQTARQQGCLSQRRIHSRLEYASAQLTWSRTGHGLLSGRKANYVLLKLCTLSAWHCDRWQVKWIFFKALLNRIVSLQQLRGWWNGAWRTVFTRRVPPLIDTFLLLKVNINIKCKNGSKPGVAWQMMIWPQI